MAIPYRTTDILSHIKEHNISVAHFLYIAYENRYGFFIFEFEIWEQLSVEPFISAHEIECTSVRHSAVRPNLSWTRPMTSLFENSHHRDIDHNLVGTNLSEGQISTANVGFNSNDATVS